MGGRGSGGGRVSAAKAVAANPEAVKAASSVLRKWKSKSKGFEGAGDPGAELKSWASTNLSSLTPAARAAVIAEARRRAGI